ncbi:uncharacterized protein LOC120822234 [Gasterosteus aculeatus]
MTTMRSIYQTHKWIKPPPPPSATPKGHRRGSGSIAQMYFEANQKTSREDYTTVYQRDFPVWKVQKCLPFKQANSFQVELGLVLTDDPSKSRSQKNSVQGGANSKPVPPFERVTCYRSDYVSHPVQSTVRVKPVHNTKGLLSHPAPSSKPEAAGEVDKDIFDGNGALCPEVNNWFPENYLQGTGRAQNTSPPADRPEHTYTGANLVRASRKAREGDRHRLWGTTMKEDYKHWKMSPLSSVRKDPNWPERPTFPPGPPEPAERRATTLTPSATKATQCPAENRARASSDPNPPGTRGSRTCWTSSFDGGGTLADGGIGGGPNECHQMISYMTSSQS